MKLAFIVDPVEQLKPAKDTSLAIMREAAKRKHLLYILEQGDLLLRHDQVIMNARSFSFGAERYDMGSKKECKAQDFDAIIMRKDPPFDMEYLTATWLLELAERQGTRIFNRPQVIRDCNEKLSVLRFPQFAPPLVVTRHMAVIRDFLQEHSDVVVKPLDSMGGNGVFRLSKQDHNLGAILETVTDDGRRTVMAQRYLPEIKQGDKRILLIDGIPIPYALARKPKAGELRANLAAGGTGFAQLLSQRDRHIAETVGAELNSMGLFFAGLDVIGDFLTEINVTSPTCMVEIAEQTDCNPAAIFVDCLERVCAIC